MLSSLHSTCSTPDLSQDFPIVQQDSCNSQHGANLAQGTFNLVSFAVFTMRLRLYPDTAPNGLMSPKLVIFAADQYLHGAWLAQHAICHAAKRLVGLGCNGSLDMFVLLVWQAHCACI